MKKLLLPLLATAALAAPAAASAHHGWFGFGRHAMLAKVSGTGTSFASASATASGTATGNMSVGTGTFSASISSDWTKATTHTGRGGTLSCAPATATLTVTGATAANTAKASLTGKTCKWTPTSGSVVSAFFGRGAATGAGALATLTGSNERAFLLQKADGTVSGAVFAGMRGMFASEFAVGEHNAAGKTGHCDRNQQH